MRFAHWVLLGALAALTPSRVWAQTSASEVEVPERVTLLVRVIRAGEGPPHMDPQLRSIAEALRRTPFQRFHWVRDVRLRLVDGQNGQVALGEGRTLLLELKKHDARQAYLDARYLREGHRPTETALRVHRDRAFFFSLKGDQPGEALLVELDLRY